MITSYQRQNFLALYLEVNEAVIKMIIKGRSPTMRHVSRTRVALDWFWDRIGPKIQIKYFDSKNQFANILTKGSFARDEWNRVLCLFDVVNYSEFSCSHFSQLNDPQAMSKRLMQEDKEENNERLCAKSRPARKMVSKTLSRSPTALSSSSSQSPRNLITNDSTLDSIEYSEICRDRFD